MLSHQCSYAQSILLSRYDPRDPIFQSALRSTDSDLSAMPPAWSTVWSPLIPFDDEPPTASTSEVMVPPPSIATEAPHAPSPSKLTVSSRSSTPRRSPCHRGLLRRGLQFQPWHPHISPRGSTSLYTNPRPHHHLMTTVAGYDSTQAGDEDLELP
jgi:hypothetical protein